MAFAIDLPGAALPTLAGLLTTVALVVSWRHFEALAALFHSLMLILLAAMVGFCLSGDLFNLSVFFELMSVAAFALAGYKSEDPSALAAGPFHDLVIVALILLFVGFAVKAALVPFHF